MIRRTLLMLIGAVVSWSHDAVAAPLAATPVARANVALIEPLSVILKDDMVFGFLSATTAGTAILDPNSGALTTTGGVVSLGGNPHPAQFIGAARSASVVNIKLPAGAITLTRDGGTETISLTALTLQGQSKRTLAKLQSFTFMVGGTLNIAADQVEGLYSGSFDVTVQYP